jgi:hypothetical protein
MSRVTNTSYVDSQLNSKLVQAPYDIRLQIFQHLIPDGIHVFFHGNALKVSQCIGCPPADKVWSGEERKGDYDPAEDYKVRRQRWGRRLMSSWGPHWKCEELMMEEEENDDYSTSCGPVNALLRTCKQL